VESSCSNGRLAAHWSVLFILSSVVLGSGIFTMGPKKLPEPHFPLLVATEGLDFGDVWEQRVFVHPITITNISSEPVVIEQFNVSCDCISVSPTSLALAAHENQDIEVSLNLIQTEGIHVVGYPVEIVIEPRVIGWRNDNVIWTITGKVTRAIEATPSVLNFHDVWRDAPVTPRVIHVHARSPVHALSVYCNPLFVEVELRNPDSPHEPYELTVVMKPDVTLSPQSFDIPISVHGHCPGGNDPPPAVIRCIGRLADLPKELTP
jgi:hypothetical protein